MRVTLAHPHDGKKAGQTIEVDTRTGRNLISLGRARPASEAQNLEDMTVPQLKQHATDNFIDLAGATRKDDILAAINGETAPPTNQPPATSADQEEVG